MAGTTAIAVNDQAFVSTACPADVALVHNGPILTTFRVRTTMRVPAEFLFDRMVRSEQFVEMVIDSLVSLRPGLDRRRGADHRPQHRLATTACACCSPAAPGADTYLADSPFDVVERPIALRADNHLYRELEVETKPQQSWTAVCDGARGLAVVSVGLLESAVRDLPERPLALTLFRGTRRTVHHRRRAERPTTAASCTFATGSCRWQGRWTVCASVTWGNCWPPACATCSSGPRMCALFRSDVRAGAACQAPGRRQAS